MTSSNFDVHEWSAGDPAPVFGQQRGERPAPDVDRPAAETRIVVYGKPKCMQCVATKRDFDKTGIQYTAVDASTDPWAPAELAQLGYRSVPVVAVMADREVISAGTLPVEHWGGHRPDRIQAAAKAVVQALYRENANLRSDLAVAEEAAYDRTDDYVDRAFSSVLVEDRTTTHLGPMQAALSAQFPGSTRPQAPRSAPASSQSTPTGDLYRAQERLAGGLGD